MRPGRLLVKLACTGILIAGCKTTGNGQHEGLKAADPASDEIPALTLDALTPGVIAKIVAEARKDAVAMFGGKALFHTMIFDNSIDAGPCAGIYGVRVIFANSDKRAPEMRKFAMYTLDPQPSGPQTCSNSMSAAPKAEADVSRHLSGTRNIDAALGGTGSIKLSLAESVGKVRADNPKFEVPHVISIMNPEEQSMSPHPWAVIYGSSCGEDGVVYVNLNSGRVIDAAKPMKRDCQ